MAETAGFEGRSQGWVAVTSREVRGRSPDLYVVLLTDPTSQEIEQCTIHERQSRTREYKFSMHPR